jgi:regulator of sigma E protease
MIFLIKASQLILSLSILVVLHELGHFIPAKLFKTRVEKFYLFFDPWFSLFKIKKGETEYGIGWLPLGGYVKISGMVDESMDTEALKEPAQPWEFRSKPAWQRLVIMLGGVTVNLILGFLIYAMVLFVYGEKFLPAEAVPYGIQVNEKLKPFGFEDGDKIITVNGEAPVSFDEIRAQLFTQKVSEMTVLRDGREFNLDLGEDFGQVLIDSNIRNPFGLRYPCVVGDVEKGAPAEVAGLITGDSLIGVNAVNSPFFFDIATEIRDNANEEVEVRFVRNGDQMQKSIPVRENGTIGFGPNTQHPAFQYRVKEYGFGEAVVGGFNEAGETLRGYVLSLRFVFSKSGATEVGSFFTLGSIFSASWDWQVFWRNTALLSLILAFMNLLPIPALDGGHVMFLLYEMIAGRPAPQKFLEKAQLVGIIILLALMAYALGNDIVKLFTGGF